MPRARHDRPPERREGGRVRYTARSFDGPALVGPPAHRSAPGAIARSRVRAIDAGGALRRALRGAYPDAEAARSDSVVSPSMVSARGHLVTSVFLAPLTREGEIPDSAQGAAATSMARPANRTALSQGDTAARPADQPLDVVLDRYARGDDAALDDLYRLGAVRVRAFLLRLCADLALADDLTQEAFLRICNARGSFVAGAPALPWMLAIARNAFLDYTRRERVRRAHREDRARIEASEPPEASEIGGDRAVLARQMLGVVQRALMTLPVRQREAFILVRFEGLSIAEAAEVLGATQGAVKILAHRAYVVVRAALEAQGGAGGPSR